MTADHPRRIGPYEVLGLLGKGAMGQVYKAVLPTENRLVAIKVLPGQFLADESRVERFEREAQAVALLNHPNVVRIIDKDREEDLLYFVMEYVPGTSLDVVMRQRRLSLHEVFRIAKGICQGLEAAHRQNIVHRDLNPRNVLVSEDLSVIKLADFGISRVEEISRQQGTLSTSEVSLGSLHYMSPEQATNMLEADHRTDIYSFGVTLYEMLTGRVPVGRFSLPSQVNNEVPSDIDPVVLKCLETDPANRYATTSQVLAELNRLEDRLKLGLVHELKGLSKQTSKILLKGTGTFRRSKIPMIAAGAVLLLLAGGGAAWLLMGRGRATEPPAEPDAGSEVVSFEVPERPQVPETEEEAPEQTEPETPEDQFAEVAPPPIEEPAETPAAAAKLQQTREDLGVARDKLAAGLTGPALEDLQRFVAQNGSSPLLPEAYLLIAQAHLDEGDTEQALAAYVEIGSRFGNSQQAPAAAFERARLVARKNGKEAAQEARLLYAAVAADYRRSSYAPPALAAQAQIENDLKLTATDPVLEERAPASLATYRTLVARYPDSAEAEWAFWQLGEAYDDLKRFELAVESFSELGRRFPKTRYDAWWRAGQILDKRLDRNEEAIAAYRQVRQSSSHHTDAQRRIGRLSR